jgi:hypothetical protein
MPLPNAKLERQRARKYKAALLALSESVRFFLSRFDAEMQDKTTIGTAQRGKKLAALANALNLENDKVRFFTLGESIHAKPKSTATQKGTKHGTASRQHP